MGSNQLPEGYLAFCSLDALESLALARMNDASNLRLQAKQLLSQLVEAEAEVRVARWMLGKRRSRRCRGRMVLGTEAVQQKFEYQQADLLGLLVAPCTDEDSTEVPETSSPQSCGQRREFQKQPNPLESRVCSDSDPIHDLNGKPVPKYRHDRKDKKARRAPGWCPGARVLSIADASSMQPLSATQARSYPLEIRVRTFSLLAAGVATSRARIQRGRLLALTSHLWKARTMQTMISVSNRAFS